MNYYNNNDNLQYCLSLPFFQKSLIDILFNKEKERNIVISPEISICSISNQNSFLRKQCNYNHKEIISINSDFVDNIIDGLKRCNTKYTLFCGNGETILTNDLDENFIEKFKLLNKPFCFVGTATGVPIDVFENEKVYFSNGIFNYACLNLAFGETEKLLDFFYMFKEFAMNVMLDINPEKINQFLFAQIYLRNALSFYSNDILVDTRRDLFTIIVDEEYDIRQNEKDKVIVNVNFILTKDKYIF